ncbi:MAG: SGNH/GDSL hydrolase family protein [Verrucomicrobia bacterium]|nr:SGNH/GDSL hydrolase family protein [Verrucomicrobiota bacterium]
MQPTRLFILFVTAFSLAANAQFLEQKPNDPYFAKFNPRSGPQPSRRVLQLGDRLAICGDSITEQKMYSRIMETYLTVCEPDLAVTVRQYGWGGETMPGFLARMTNDCLRFRPTIATTCYGMNDHGYRAYAPEIGQRYREASLAVVRALKHAGARVVLGSPGCVGPKVPWAKGSAEELNLNLAELRNIDIEIAIAEKIGFADVFWPMFKTEFAAHKKYGPDYLIAGKDAVHPNWAGHLVMAYAFLKAFGLNGDIGTITVKLDVDRASVSRGHELLAFNNGVAQIKSRRYPFCAAGGDLSKDDNIRSAMTLIPFNQDLNRFTLVAKGGMAKNYKVTWGEETKSYSAEQLEKGVNLADDFPINPFSEAFAKVDAAVAAKQAYETKQIKQLFHGEEGRADMAATVALTEKARAPLAAAIRINFVPVNHTIKIVAE